MEAQGYASKNSFSPSSGGLPKINGSGGIARGQTINIARREHDTVMNLKRSFVGEHHDKVDQKQMFNPPNITAFKQAEFGPKGSLFNEANQRQTMDQQAILVENRVKILEKEEEKMNKKIREAMRQTEKMEIQRDEQNQRYQRMREFRAMQDWETDQQRMKNQDRKAQSQNRYVAHKEQVLRTNQGDYANIREQRQACLEEKYNIIQQNTLRLQDKFNRQKSQEIRLKNMYSTLKTDRLNKNKNRYDDQTAHNQQIKDQHNARLEQAAKREQALIARMAHTMNAQKQAIATLEGAIQENKKKKADRVEPLDGQRLRQNQSTNHHFRNNSQL